MPKKTVPRYRYEGTRQAWPRRYIILSTSGAKGEPDVFHATVHTKRMAALMCRLLNAQQNAGARYLKADLLAAMQALVICTRFGQWCYRSHNDIPMGLSKKQTRLVKIAMGPATTQQNAGSCRASYSIDTA